MKKFVGLFLAFSLCVAPVYAAGKDTDCSTAGSTVSAKYKTSAEAYRVLRKVTRELVGIQQGRDILISDLAAKLLVYDTDIAAKKRTLANNLGTGIAEQLYVKVFDTFKVATGENKSIFASTSKRKTWATTQLTQLGGATFLALSSSNKLIVQTAVVGLIVNVVGSRDTQIADNKKIVAKNALITRQQKRITDQTAARAKALADFTTAQAAFELCLDTQYPVV